MNRPISIFLGDMLHPSNQNKTFPYAGGCVGAYVAEALGDRVVVEVFRSPEDMDAAFQRCQPDIIGFSNYLWTLELTYEVIRRLKAKMPNVPVIMGGPNYPTDAADQRAFLTRYSLVDFYVVKEGEAPFLALIEQLLELRLDGAVFKEQRRTIPAVHYLINEDFVAPPPAPRQRDLDAFPSAYLSGLLDKFFTRHDLTPLIQTKRGCPFQCTFCVEGEDYYTKVGSVTTTRFRAELEYIASRMANGSPLLQIADSNFGMFEHDLEVCDVIAEVRDTYGWPQTIEVSTGKNRKERVLEAVRRTKGAMRFGPALQTTDRQTLQNIKRSNISETVLIEMASAAKDSDQRSYTELILNLPGDTIASHLTSIRAAMEAGMQRIKMYPLMLLPGTEMASEESRREFGIETRFRVLPTCYGNYTFLGETFPSVEIAELVVATNSMNFADYLHCKRFELSVEIFYNDIYLEEIHGLARALNLPMFTFVERCHAQFDSFPAELKEVYSALEHGVCDNLFDSRDACLEHFRDPDHLLRYAREEYKNSLGALKAIALVEHIEPLLVIARRAFWECMEAAGLGQPSLAEYLDELIEYSRLRRRQILDIEVEPEGTFQFAFDQIGERAFRVDPRDFRLRQPQRMRFWHDEAQARDLRRLRSDVSNPILRARSFIYPATDPGVNPYLRHARFC